jgi:hypothetical protein
MKVGNLFFIIIFGLSIFLTANAGPSADPKELEKREFILPLMPEAPEGYSWKVFYGIGILCPNAWTFTYPLEQEQGSCLNPNNPETILTIEIFTVMDEGYSPAQLSGQFMKKISDIETNKIDIFDPINDERVVFRYHSDVEKLKIHKYFIANNKSKELFVISFKTPTDSWETTWKTGEVVFKQVALLPWDE